jgi:hypothetical protein
MRRLLKVLLISIISIVLITLLVIVGGAIWIKSSPEKALALGQQFIPYQITATNIDLLLAKPALMAEGLRITNTDGQSIAVIANLTLDTTWKNLLWGGTGPAVISIKDAIINSHELNQTTENPAPSNHTSTVDKINVHKILQTTDVSLTNIKVQLSEHQHIVIKAIKKLSGLEDQQQGLEFSLHYQEADKRLPIVGQLLSTFNKDIPELSVTIPTLDLRAFGDADNHVDSANTQTTESTIDWAPLLLWAPLAINLQSDDIQLPQGQVSAMISRIELGKVKGHLSIKQEHTAKLDININDDYSLKQPITINTQWQALDHSTLGTDFTGVTKISLGEHTLSTTGKFNLNGFIGNQFTLDLGLRDFPLLAKSSSAKEIKVQTAPLLPLSVRTHLSTTPTQLSASTLELKASTSDFQGDITLQLTPTLDQLQAISFDLSSSQLVITPSTKRKTIKKTEESQQSGNVFNDDTLDISWLDAITAEGHLTIDKLIYNNTVLAEETNTTLSLKDNTLAIQTSAKQLAKGSVALNIIATHKDGLLHVTTDGQAKGILLEALALLPKEELSGGKTNIDMALTSHGLSTQALASQLQGSLLLVSKEGIIANNSFELIGSDVFLKLINTINPFSKKATNTELECAVVHSKIENGKLLFDDSIVIKTSKMIIIADGDIDLATEKINLGINPKARSGLGVDLASLAKFVALQGSLTEPSIGVSGKGSLKSALSISAAVSTGGLSLLAGSLLDKASSAEPCQAAIDAFK